MRNKGLDIWERRLAGGVRTHLRHLGETGATGGRELEATLLRLGFGWGDVRALVDRGTLPGPENLRAMQEALTRDLACQARSARAARPGYDINRHIAVSRALRQFTARIAADGPPAGEPGQPRGASREPSASRSSAMAASRRACMRR